MAQTEAQKAAKKKYNKKVYDEGRYKQLNLKLKPDEYNMIDRLAKYYKLSKTSFVIQACKAVNTRLKDGLRITIMGIHAWNIKYTADKYNVTDKQVLIKCFDYCKKNKLLDEILQDTD